MHFGSNLSIDGITEDKLPGVDSPILGAKEQQLKVMLNTLDSTQISLHLNCNHLKAKSLKSI